MIPRLQVPQVLNGENLAGAGCGCEDAEFEGLQGRESMFQQALVHMDLGLRKEGGVMIQIWGSLECKPQEILLLGKSLEATSCLEGDVGQVAEGLL